jgi:hypothetical protein
MPIYDVICLSHHGHPLSVLAGDPGARSSTDFIAAWRLAGEYRKCNPGFMFVAGQRHLMLPETDAQDA